jgi:hypothetical protein
MSTFYGNDTRKTSRQQGFHKINGKEKSKKWHTSSSDQNLKNWQISPIIKLIINALPPTELSEPQQLIQEEQ